MIEFCSKKRMVFAIAALAGLSFLIIILESSQLRSHQEELQDIHETHPVLKEKLRPEDKCWMKEKFSARRLESTRSCCLAISFQRVYCSFLQSSIRFLPTRTIRASSSCTSIPLLEILEALF